MDVCYAQKIAKYVQNPEVDVRIRPNFEARRKVHVKIFGKLVSSLSSDMTEYDMPLMS